MDNLILMVREEAREGSSEGGREGGKKGGRATYLRVEGRIDVIPPRLSSIEREETMKKVEGSGEGEIDALGGKGGREGGRGGGKEGSEQRRG